jgi:hypothetical protein
VADPVVPVSTSCQGRQILEPPFDQRKPLGAAPVLDLFLQSERLSDMFELGLPTNRTGSRWRVYAEPSSTACWYIRSSR